MNATTKNTPGPWVFCTDDAGWDRITIEQDRAGMPMGEEPSVVGEVYDGGDGIDRATAEANARLIATAPDLLAVVRMVAGNGIPGPMPHFPPANLASAERLAEIVDAARAAIARATGGGA